MRQHVGNLPRGPLGMTRPYDSIHVMKSFQETLTPFCLVFFP